MGDESDKLKLEMIAIKLGSLETPAELASLLVETLDPQSLLFISQRAILDKMVENHKKYVDEIEEQKRIIHNLEVNNAFLTGIEVVDDNPQLTEYERIMGESN